MPKENREQNKRNLKEAEEKAEGIDVENLESLNVGIFGHIDHGKTTLVYQLTGKWTDTHSEELKRGITIKLGYADCIIRKEKNSYNTKSGEVVRYVSFVDAPGHEMLMATMLSGAAIVDAAVLVISANEGIKPQTKEHLMALQTKNIRNIIIVQNKIDLVNREQALENYKIIKKFIEGTIAENASIIPCSARQGVNLEAVLEELIKIKIPERDLNSEPLFIIARSFDINKPGSKINELKGGVLGGALKKGRLKIGDEIEIKPGLVMKKENQIVYKTLETKIVGIYKGSYKIREATPGGSIAIETELDTILTKADNLTGCVVGLQGKLPAIRDRIQIKFSLFKEVLGVQEKLEVENIKATEMLLLSINTSVSIGTVTKVKENEAELSLRIPVMAFSKENVGIARNINGHWRLIGWGEII